MNLLNTNTRSLAMPSRKPAPSSAAVRGIGCPRPLASTRSATPACTGQARVAIGLSCTTHPEVA